MLFSLRSLASYNTFCIQCSHTQTHLILCIFFSLIAQLKEFVLNQPEAYEIKIGDQVFRRPGDPPLEEVIEKVQTKGNKADKTSPTDNDGHEKDEL